ncbi:hypothetical protein AWH48_11990 [Domibacillus aminovorans]|uniref:Baseplate protein J-like barrel domain-containing protein n=1 Tax=Domibacillus aminovorans TaxID=29332 RepID=A0A177KI44_9BACI|nr:baseplate J/gp47 family protein [Domibacillus aminovorans]OAH53072.1 hypothetical protein AWH48_11990 [Domibacillus aminovorans]
MLDKNGFKRKTYAELIDDMGIKSRELYGENINISPRSPLGIIIRLFAYFLSVVWELSEQVYNAGSVSKADGVSLDRRVKNRGITRELASESMVLLTFTGTPGFVIPEQRQFSTETDIYFYLIEDVTLDETGNGAGQAVSVEKGAYTRVGENTITVQVEPLSGVTSVNNLQPAEGGQDVEKDEALRARYFKQVEGATTIPGMRSKLLELPGIQAVNIVENEKNVADADGRPPHSFETYVLGGNDQEIAETIFRNKAGGIQPYGAIEKTVLDDGGWPKKVGFTRAEVVNVSIKATLTTNSAFASNGANQVRTLLVSYIGGEDADQTLYPGLSMGIDVVLWRLSHQIAKVPGVSDLQLTVSTDDLTYTASNIDILPLQVARTKAADIEVILIA